MRPRLISANAQQNVSLRVRLGLMLDSYNIKVFDKYWLL